MGAIIERVAKTFKVSGASLLRSQRGRAQENIPRWVTMHLSQEIVSNKLSSIVQTFGFKKTESILTTATKLQVLMKEDASLLMKINRTKAGYDT